MHHSEAKEDINNQVIKLLLKYGAEPHFRNLHTSFTPLHWCAGRNWDSNRFARHEGKNNVKILFEAGAKQWIPDFMGF